MVLLGTLGLVGRNWWRSRATDPRRRR
ncbi:MAG: hypothetical protein QOI68_4526, partial [Pseudonocardiales bacterium]|nr:hypothetical protein [Pseudonocardiales bacterium]